VFDDLIRDGDEMTGNGTAGRQRFLLFDGCNYRSLLFTNPLFRGLFHF
jgi:hypothetical protein